MVDPDEQAAGSILKRWLLLFALLIGLIFLVAFVVGFMAAHFEKGGGFGLYGGSIIAVAALAILGCGWLMVRKLRTTTGEEPLTRKERLNRNLLIGSGVLGAVIALALIFSQDGGISAAGGVFSNAPLPPAVALGLVLVLGLLVPAISYFWHQAVDEQEVDAYKTGALYSFYVYGIGAPIWWLAWRGGFAPEPSGIIIYFATIGVMGVAWTWKKYG
jgi:hypothetical protein